MLKESKRNERIEMLKESKRNESGTWYSEMKMGHDMIEMLKESKRNESGFWYSEMKMGHDIKVSARFISAGLVISSRTKNIRREVVIDRCRYLARLNTMDGFF